MSVVVFFICISAFVYLYMCMFICVLVFCISVVALGSVKLGGVEKGRLF